MSRYGNYKSTFNATHETAQKAISNNIPNLVKALEQRKSKTQRQILYIISFFAIIISIVFWYFIIINILK